MLQCIGYAYTDTFMHTIAVGRAGENAGFVHVGLLIHGFQVAVNIFYKS